MDALLSAFYSLSPFRGQAGRDSRNFNAFMSKGAFRGMESWFGSRDEGVCSQNAAKVV
jgi:hypothetical protein